MAGKLKSKRFKGRGNKFYDCTLRNSKVTVRLQRTAQGQAIIVGTYNLLEKKWENESSKNFVPIYIKTEVEEFFS